MFERRYIFLWRLWKRYLQVEINDFQLPSDRIPQTILGSGGFYFGLENCSTYLKCSLDNNDVGRESDKEWRMLFIIFILIVYYVCCVDNMTIWRPVRVWLIVCTEEYRYECFLTNLQDSNI